MFASVYIFAFVAILALTVAFRPMASPRILSKSSLEMKLTGKVKFFDAKKGFGFIVPDNGGEDIFVHQSVIHAQGFRSLAEGESVEYEVQVDTQKAGKKSAVDVTGPNGAYVIGAKRPSVF